MKNVTIQDIAKEAGVSKSTVSRTLNNTTAVHPEKRRAILEATERLGFRPSIVARSLSRGRSMTVGVLTQNIGSPFYDTISQGVIIGLEGTGYSPIFADGQWKQENETEAIRALQGRRVDGLVIIGGDILPEKLENLCGQLPTIHVARKLTSEQHHCIFSDNVDAGYRATRFLIESGHREIAIIKGIAEHPDAIDRLTGYQTALSAAGIEQNPHLILDGDFTAESGERAVEQLIASEEKFTAILSANDMTAFGARLGLYRHGIHVPNDVSLVGFDDQAEAAFMAPPLTTIRQPARQMGIEASQSLLALIAGHAFSPQSFKGELQIRESVTEPTSDTRRD